MHSKIEHGVKRHLHLEHVDFLSIFDKFDEGIIIVDQSGVIVYYNDTMAKIDDLLPEYALGKKVTTVYDITDETSMIMGVLRTGQPIINRTFFYRTRMGKVANTIHSVFPLHEEEGLIGAICFVKDYNILEATIISISPPRPTAKHTSGALFTFKEIIGENPELKRCITTAKMAANSPSPIMLYGETGTGKELVSQSIHNFSSRRSRRYIPINCTAIPENLLEGILFGTSKGAFTGALDRPGLFEQAAGGTLFLDEINSMPVGLQTKILRVLQEKKLRRLGSLNEINLDVKIISSVNREPHRDIEEKALRPDLFYRLGVVFIRIPPLRDRRDDISRLVEHFLNKIGTSHGIHVQGIGRRVINSFYEYGWPGNVRELEHVIEGAMNIVGDGETIRLKHLPSYFLTESRRPAAKAPVRKPVLKYPADAPAKSINENRNSIVPFTGGQSLTETKSHIENDMLRRALAGSRGNVTLAAQTLGISRQLLNYKIKKLQLDRKDFK